jgi:pimeloyl-ACP methyl ester carboxylesterase
MALALNAVEIAPEGLETAQPLLVAHGLFGSGRNFASIGRRLAEGRRVVLVDMRNHGASPWDADCSYRAMAEDLAEAVETRCGGRAVVLGHSMGGKAAMALALSEPARLAGLVVADIAPVAYAHAHGEILEAMRALDLSRVARRSDADPMLVEAVPEAPLRAFLLQNLVIEEGRARWRINLDALAAETDRLTGFPEDWPHAGWSGPALFLHGTASRYVTPAMHGAIRARFPAAEIEGIEGAGHWLHAERPDAFVEAVRAWLARL